MQHQQDIEALRERGERLTPQRLMTLEIIKSGGGHLTAEEIHRLAQRQQPYISLATIYRTLQWLQDQGLVHLLSLGGERNYYEYRGGDPHHHLICRSCATIVEIDDAVLQSLREQLRERYGFQVQLQHLALQGLCSRCAGAEPGAQP